MIEQIVPVKPGCNICGVAVEAWSYEPARTLVPPFVLGERFTFNPCGHEFTNGTAVLLNERWRKVYPRLMERRP